MVWTGGYWTQDLKNLDQLNSRALKLDGVASNVLATDRRRKKREDERGAITTKA